MFHALTFTIILPGSGRATLVLQNSGLRDVKGWDVIIEFTHNELITAIKYAQVGPELPYPGKNLIISGIPELSDTIVTAIHAGGDSTLENTSIPEWFAVVRMPALDNVSAVYSFNNATISRDTALFWGHEYSNNCVPDVVPTYPPVTKSKLLISSKYLALILGFALCGVLAYSVALF
ncbi:unnamed protein product [Closterium sp. NIES-64]|nr:unnamed protein product [Closterium sp. NIES-64]